MNRIHLAWGAAALAVTGIAGTAFAQQAMHKMHDPMGTATITRAEAQAKAGAMFDRMDANKDGRLDKADREARMSQRFDAMDTNRDGKLDKAEFMAAHAGTGEGMKPGGERMMGHGMGPKMGRGMMALHMLGKMDVNGDKSVTRAEFVDGMLKRFDSADANRDGKVTPEERRSAMRAHMGGMRKMHGGMMGQEGHAKGDMPPPAQ